MSPKHRNFSARVMVLLCSLFPLAHYVTLASSSLIVPNPSFEDPGSNGPTGWTFIGPGEALPGAWTAETPFAGQRALRINARYGSQSWESALISVRVDQQHLLQWQTRFQGEKSWRFRAAFCGVVVVFRDKEGHALDSARQHTSCWQTRGWQPGWFLFATPAATRTIQVRFEIETKAPLPGGFDIDDLKLEEWPPVAPPRNSDLSLLTLKIEDEIGRPVAARIQISNAKGEAVRPAGAIAYEQGQGAFHPLEEGACYALVPRGHYAISVTRGFEYEPWERKVEVTKKHHDVLIRLVRPWDWRRRGWFCGDHHTHLFRHGGSLFPTLRWPDVMRVARAEGLDFLPFMGADRYPSQKESTAAGHTRPDFAYELTEEITEDFWGHVCPIGTSAKAKQDPRFDEGPMNFDRFAAMSGTGGVFCYGHPHGPFAEGDDLEPLANRAKGLVAREFPLDLALGVPCGIDLLAMEGPRNLLERKLLDLYRLWNLGFRPAVTASTDFHVDQGRQPIGSVRTYVRSGVLDMPAIAAAYRAGHTFATSGPLIDLHVAGAGPGDEVRLSTRGERVQVDCEAVSIGRLDRIEIIVNGRVFRTFAAAQPHRVTGSCEVVCDGSLWVAARVYGHEDPHLANQLEGRPLGAPQFAHTTPVYVLAEGKPIFAATAADADYFARWCDAVLAGYAGHQEVVTERLSRARKVFSDLAAGRP